MKNNVTIIIQVQNCKKNNLTRLSRKCAHPLLIVVDSYTEFLLDVLNSCAHQACAMNSDFIKRQLLLELEQVSKGSHIPLASATT